MRKLWVWLIILVLGTAVVASVYFIGLNRGKNSSTYVNKSYSQSKYYPLLAKRIFIENPNDPQVNFEPLRRQIKEYYANNNLKGSIYFEYLPTGTSIRVDGDEMRAAASLIKLPAAMELYKAAEEGKLSLDTKIELKPEWLDSGYGDLYKKGAGYQLSLREAVEIMLQKSDNTALKAVGYSVIGKLPAEKSPFNAIDIDSRQEPDLSVAISARSYSSFLKCLYFACYNNKQDSQEMLKLLTNSTFNNRLVAGISDKSAVVAHKIGVYNQTTQSDCGIVYVDKRNYILCAMINGPDGDATDRKISDISKLAYDYIMSLK